MKNTKLIIIYLLLFITGKAQQSLDINLFSPLLVPGSRNIQFELTDAANLEVFVVYGKNEHTLRSISSFSEASSRNLPRGKAMLRNGRTSQIVECNFIFPHKFHNRTPNRHAFALRHFEQDASLRMQGYLTQSELTTLPFMLLASAPFGVTIPPSSVDLNPLVIEKGECVYFKVFRRYGQGRNRQEQSSPVQSLRMPDSYNIAIAGDSFASGEGAPDKAFNAFSNLPQWTNADCHRSSKSGITRAVKYFIHKHPEVAVDFASAACSGARIEELHEEIEGTSSGVSVSMNQFKQLHHTLIEVRKHDQINLLLMSIGGNNAEFALFVTSFIYLPNNINDLPESFFDQLEDLINQSGLLYENLDDDINDLLGSPRPYIGICTYPDPTNGPFGRCGCSNDFSQNMHYYCATLENSCPVSDTREYETLSNRLLKPLNRNIRRSANNLGWNIIDVENMAGEHGLCNCDEPYFNTLLSSILTQNDEKGTAHPNSQGYKKIYRDKVYNFIHERYEDYFALYTFATILGTLEPPAPCNSNQEIFRRDSIKFQSVNFRAVQIQEQLKRSKQLKTILLKIKSGKEFVNDGIILNSLQNQNSHELANSITFKKLLTDDSLKTIIMNLPEFKKDKPNIITARHTRIKPTINPNLSRWINNQKTLLEGREWKNLVQKTKVDADQSPTAPKGDEAYDILLDSLYNY